MEVVEIARLIHADARAAWELVGDFTGSELTRGYVARVERRGHGVGSLRLYHLEPHLGGSTVVELLEEQNDTRMVMRYSMPDNGAIPWTQYSGSVRIQAAGADCVVLVRTEFVPLGGSAEALRQMSLNNIDAFFANLAGALARSAEVIG